MASPDECMLMSDTREEFAKRIQVEASAIKQLLASVPASSSYYLDVGHPPPAPPAPPGLKAWERRVASALFDVHSRICAWRLLVAWRSQELITVALHAFDRDELIAASALTRALFENAAALTVESMQLARTWPAEGSRAFRNEEVVLQWRSAASGILAQPLWGTRQSQSVNSFRPKRIQILTLIDKAAKYTGKADLRLIYERLCDVVHPSSGANSAYYSTAGRQGGFEDLIYIKLSIGFNGFDGLGAVLGDAWGWSLQGIASGLRRLSRIANCLCMAAKLYVYEDLGYWGVVQPTGEYDPCPCGSGFRLRFCKHAIPDDETGK
jgi:hypothetical protein